MGINSDLAVTTTFGVLAVILAIICGVNVFGLFLLKKTKIIGKTKHWWGWGIGAVLSALITIYTYLAVD